MLKLAFRNLLRCPLRNGLTVSGLGAAVAVLAFLAALGTGYQRRLGLELDRMGMQLMLVPLGCPYDAAARVLKGSLLENSLPEAALTAVRADPDVAVAAPLLMTALSGPAHARADVWVGLDESARQLKPWWREKAGTNWFPETNSVIIGAEAAEVEMRAPGDKLFSPETGRTFRVAGVLERSGTSDDSLYFVPLRTAQAMFDQPGRLTAIAIRLRDPTLVRQVSERLQAIPGAQVVTLTEMMGTFLNLVGSVRTLAAAVGLIALSISVLGVLNTLLAAVVERAGELSLLRAMGASRRQVFGLMATESLLLALIGSALGLGLVALGGAWAESIARRFVPFAPEAPMCSLTGTTVVECMLMGVTVGLVACIYPAWRASLAHPGSALREA